MFTGSQRDLTIACQYVDLIRFNLKNIFESRQLDLNFKNGLSESVLTWIIIKDSSSAKLIFKMNMVGSKALI